MFDKELFNRMKELSNLPSEKPKIQEDDLNYYVYELFEDCDIEGQKKRSTNSYLGYIKINITKSDLPNNKYNLKDISESLKFEEKLYRNYIENEMDTTFLTESDNIKITSYSVTKEENDIILYIKYSSKILF